MLPTGTRKLAVVLEPQALLTVRLKVVVPVKAAVVTGLPLVTAPTLLSMVAVPGSADDPPSKMAVNATGCPGPLLDGLAKNRETFGGGQLETVTVTGFEATANPVDPVAISVYVVVIAGETSKFESCDTSVRVPDGLLASVANRIS